MIEGADIVVFVTAPRGKGEELAKRLVEERLAACINVLSGVASHYWWKGRVERSEEDLIILKSSVRVLDKLVARVKELHEYEVPEVIAMPIVAGYSEYLRWLRREVASRGGS